VLAARQLYPDQLSNRLAIVGHSQGGQAALFGAHHAPTWTPDLDLRGVAALAPVSDIYTLVTAGCLLPVTDKGFAFTALFLSGAIAGDPNIKPTELLGAEAYKRWPHIYTRARIELSEDDSWGGLLGIQQLSPSFPWSPKNPSREAFIDQLNLMHPDLDIRAPVRISQANEDVRVKAEFTYSLFEQLAARNGPDNVTYKPYPEVSKTDNPELGYHFGLMETDLPLLTEWLEARFAETDLRV
jgi:alpha-beta hydrolase superfamily lysophospholipase